MLSSRFLFFRPAVGGGHSGRLGRIYDSCERTLRRVDENYSGVLKWALGHRRIVIGLTAVLFVCSIVLIRFIGVELMPAADEGEVRVDIEMAVGTRLEIIDQATLNVEEIIRAEVPEMVSMLSRAGGGFGGARWPGSLQRLGSPMAQDH